mgnify:CR=1 FL=1
MLLGMLIASLFITILFFYSGLDWLGFVFLAILVAALFYSLLKNKAKESWEDLKKADAFYPEAKLNEYIKGASKTVAENLSKTKNTEINYKAWIHKTHKIAKNFFSELGELFK